MSKQLWQLENEALEALGFSGTNGNPDRERAVEVVISLLKEIDSLRKGKTLTRVCIWTAYENNFVPYIQSYQPECQSRYFNGQLEGDYCPFCGGKIEVKE
jgi:hypothetical protein